MLDDDDLDKLMLKACAHMRKVSYITSYSARERMHKIVHFAESCPRNQRSVDACVRFVLLSYKMAGWDKSHDEAAEWLREHEERFNEIHPFGLEAALPE